MRTMALLRSWGFALLLPFLVVQCDPVEPAPDGGSTAHDGGSLADLATDFAPDLAPDLAPAWRPCRAGEECRILTVGDSITAGYPHTTFGGYREPLWGLLGGATFVGSYGPVPGVANAAYHDGFNGYTIAQVAPFFPDHIATYRPHVVLLHLGTNDLEQWEPAPAERLASLVDVIVAAAPAALVVVAQVIPQAIDDGTHPAFNRDAATAAYNAQIRDLVAARAALGQHVATADLNTAFRAAAVDYGTMLADGLHPTDAGYTVMAQAWFATLAPFWGP